MNLGTLFSGPDMTSALMPEWILLLGIIAMFVVPNLGDGTFRLPIPGKSIRVPYFIGGKRFSITSDPRIPAGIAGFTLLAAFVTAFMSQMIDSTVGMGIACLDASGTVHTDCSIDQQFILKVDAFSRTFEMIFYAALLIGLLANTDRMPGTALNRIALKPHKDEIVETRRLKKLLNNRRQVDFHLLLLMVALGMSIVALSTNLFMLFIGLEIASLASYVMISFLKETKTGPEAGLKYFIVGSVSSAIGLYGISLLYLWSGSVNHGTDANPLYCAPTLSLTGSCGLASDWAAMNGIETLPLLGLGFMLVAFGFKVSAVPFHFATPDAYSGASGPVAGVLSTASKAMGFLALMRVLIGITLGEDGNEWYILIGVVAAITMTWGNIAALGSRNPKRMLAYSSVAHAGYILAGIAAIGAIGPGSGSELIATAIIFHLAVLVSFKFGAFLVVSLLECEGRGHELEHYHGLARRDPIIAISMLIFMLALAGVPPLSGFLSKLMMVNGIISSTIGDASGADLSTTLGGLSWVFWLAILIFVNSALSVFYYLRLVVVMFFEDTDRPVRLSRAPMLRIAIMLCTMGAVVFGFGVLADALIEAATDAAAALFS
ncbi:MAG: NADH-quinone oxidoreductase subunit N [Candidatus Thalassarchaeaceae archaeon]|nr:NADH-quinone oxidoreductase subunit N [Candidatus Thalassarchaeaceae archaeon]